MPLPLIAPIVVTLTRLLGGRIGAAALGGGAISGALPGGRFGLFGGGNGGQRRRRRRRRLTQSELEQLAHIKSILGKTAAANALPFFLGRGS